MNRRARILLSTAAAVVLSVAPVLKAGAAPFHEDEVTSAMIAMELAFSPMYFETDSGGVCTLNVMDILGDNYVIDFRFVDPDKTQINDDLTVVRYHALSDGGVLNYEGKPIPFVEFETEPELISKAERADFAAVFKLSVRTLHDHCSDPKEAEDPIKESQKIVALPMDLLTYESRFIDTCHLEISHRTTGQVRSVDLGLINAPETVILADGSKVIFVGEGAAITQSGSGAIDRIELETGIPKAIQRGSLSGTDRDNIIRSFRIAVDFLHGQCANR